TEAFLGVMQSIVDMIGTGGYQHVQEMVAEVVIVLEIMKALKGASEGGARLIITLPTEDDRTGPRAADIRKYLGSAGGSSDERVRLFRLAWDMTISGFGGRQSLSGRFFFGG